MALTETAIATETDDDFVVAVARNIKTLLAMRGMQAQDLGDRIGMSSSKLSQRMGGHSRWLAIELRRVAQAFQVDTDVLFAASEQEFREALARSRCSLETGRSRSHLAVVPDYAEGPQGQLFPPADDDI